MPNANPWPLSLRRCGCLLILGLCVWLGACARDDTGLEVDPLALDAPTLAAEIAAGHLTAEAVTAAALDRIAAIDDRGPAIHAIIEINPDALAIARDLDRRFAAGGTVGPLHGMPVVLKANIDTGDAMATSAGSIALADHHAARDAPVVARLREAGAVVIGKSNLSEWANFRDRSSLSGWSSLGGQTLNPYALDRDPCGSSSGSAVAVAARLVPLAVGTETDGSIVCPAAANGVVGIKPTLGLIEQTGIIPIAATQDTAGPMARTVRGAALLLAAMRPDTPARDWATGGPVLENLEGIRIGVLRDYGGAGTLTRLEAAYDDWIGMLEDAGATIVDPVELSLPAAVGAAELEVLRYEFRSGLNAYLAAVESGPSSLEELISFNRANAARVMPLFGQSLLIESATRGDLTEPAYLEALRQSRDVVRDKLGSTFAAAGLDALIAPANSPAAPLEREPAGTAGVSSSRIAAVSGYPSIVVPAATIDGLPVALAFVGEPFTEDRLIGIAAVFEAARGDFPPPDLP